MLLLEEVILWTNALLDTIEVVDENAMPTMILAEDALNHHLRAVMNEETTAIEIERDTGLPATIVLHEVEVAVIVEAGGGVVGHHTMVVRPAGRSFWKDCQWRLQMKTLAHTLCTSS